MLYYAILYPETNPILVMVNDWLCKGSTVVAIVVSRRIRQGPFLGSWVTPCFSCVFCFIFGWPWVQHDLSQVARLACQNPAWPKMMNPWNRQILFKMVLQVRFTKNSLQMR